MARERAEVCGTHLQGLQEARLETIWYKNGQKEEETTFKDGEPDGLETSRHENGQMSLERTWKDRKVDGLSTIWHENGEKEWEGNFKDGEKISEKEWDKDGNPK